MAYFPENIRSFLGAHPEYWCSTANIHFEAGLQNAKASSMNTFTHLRAMESSHYQVVLWLVLLLLHTESIVHGEGVRKSKLDVLSSSLKATSVRYYSIYGCSMDGAISPVY